MSSIPNFSNPSWLKDWHKSISSKVFFQMYSLLFVNGLGFDDFSKQGVPYQEQFEGLIGNGKTFSKRSVVWFALHVCGTYGRQE